MKKQIMIQRILILSLLLTSLQAVGAGITFRLNMSGYSGFTTPQVSGTFNNWCGNCNPMSDPDGDGIWEATINLPAGNIQYKFSFGNWAAQENLSNASGCVASDGQFTNRTLTVQGDAVLDLVCWGLCTDCLEPDAENWVISWSDEFDGAALDLDTWTHELGSSGWGNNELQNYTNSSNNLEVSNGSLKIIARSGGPGSNSYSSARIISNNKVEIQYGKIEARIKVPVGQGIWPAFWMLGANYESVGWPQCGEIDIMEHVNNEPLTNAAMHWNQGGHTYRSSSVPFDATEFHLYGAIWNEEGVTFLLDDQPWWHFPFSQANNTAPIFQNPFFFLLNVAVGGNWPGNPNASTPFPATMEVDYIRVFEIQPLGQSRVDLSAIKIYPVPATDHFTISVGVHLGPWTYRIFDLEGREVLSGNAADGAEVIDTRNWKAGIYVVEVRNGGSVRTVRVVRELWE